MHLIFIFSDEHSSQGASIETIKTSTKFPDCSQEILDCRTRIEVIAQLVGHLTESVLRITCKELSLQEVLIKESKESKFPVGTLFRQLLLQFERWNGSRIERRQLKIHMPIKTPFGFSLPKRRQKEGTSLQRYLIQPNRLRATEEIQRDYLNIINALAENCLYLLNIEKTQGTSSAWTFAGFHPYWLDKAAVTQSNKRAKKAVADKKRRLRTDQKATETGTSNSRNYGADAADSQNLALGQGQGRRRGAIPGRFKGVQMRSQLEIRFAAHLEEKNIRWIYEAERLGDEQYLVDFYLPDLKIRVEVKGSFEPRDNFQLPGVAVYLARERKERLFVYTGRKAFEVSANGFKALTHREFWAEIQV